MLPPTSSSNTPPAELKITVPLKLYLHRVFAGDCFEKMSITNEEALIISTLDKQEFYCHIEMPPGVLDNITMPRIWTRRGWNESYNKWTADKARSAQQRRIACVFSENRARVVKHLQEMSGLDESVLRDIAGRIVMKNKKLAIDVFGVEIEEP